MEIEKLIGLLVRNHSGPPMSEEFYDQLVKDKLVVLPMPSDMAEELKLFNKKSEQFQRAFVYGDPRPHLFEARYPKMDAWLNNLYEVET